MKIRWLALSTLFACSVATAQVPQKMPVPVEDDPNAPAEMRGNTAAQATPPAKPGPAATTSAAPPEVSAPSSPYSQAMVEYKAGAYQKAFETIQGVDPTTQDDNFVILESAILAELKRYDDGEKLLKGRIQEREQARAPATQVDPLLIALGDLLLHRHAYDRAAKFYQAALQDKPNDPDLTLKLVYAHIGDNDLRGADQLASTLNPFNPKDPYDDHASYYFAQAALAQAIGHSGDAEEDIQQARTNYGVIVVNRYLKAYLEFFAQPEGKAPSGIAPAKP